MPADNDTAATPVRNGTVLDLDQSVEEMLDVVGRARRTRDEKKNAASNARAARTAEIITVKSELTTLYNARVQELDDLAQRLTDEETRVAEAADREYNLAVYGDERGPEFNRYGERLR